MQFNFDALRKMLAILFIFSAFGLSLSFGQTVFTGQVPANFDRPELPGIEAFEVYQMDISAIHDFIHAPGQDRQFRLVFGQLEIPAHMVLHPLRRPATPSLLMTEAGLTTLPSRPDILFRGLSGNPDLGVTLLAVNEGFFAGAFLYQGKEYMIEPLWHHLPAASRDLVVVYQVELASVTGNPICGTDEVLHQCADPNHDHGTADVEEDDRSLSCKEIEYASALDWAFVNKYGGPNGAWDRVDLVMGLVETQYTGHFNNDYIFIRTHEFASNCSSCDPSVWTTTTNSSTLLTNFRSWGQGGGFGNTAYDVASLWTNRTFQSGVVGIAYVGGMCNSFKYNCLMDFSTQNWAMRVMVAHELGHNLNCQHDGGSGFIMSPSVNNTSTWSAGSKTTVNNYTAGNQGSCMTNCVPQSPPIADFSGSPTEGCLPFTVNFTDLSVGGATSWNWSFPGGTPSSSTAQNPTVTYATKGSYNVSLTASNAAGNNTTTKSDYITVNDVPVAFFDEIPDENIVSFINLSDDATSYLWEFGDGDTSTDENPIHVYPGDGVYQVTLTATNSCGSATFSKFLTIVTSPIADFASNVIDGCTPLVVEFEDQSTPNTTSWSWQFPGGNPATSNEKNPVVTYPNAGSFNVTLTATNSAGQSVVTKTNYITAFDSPNADFNYTVKIDSVFFSVVGSPDSVHWNFGDGNSSSLMNPVHVYAQEGVYQVTLQVFTSCGDGEATKDVTVVFLPESNFSADELQGCVPFAVNFMQQASPNTTDYLWLFPGGQPASSTDPDPTVQYNAAGKYSVTLIVSNSAGSDTLTKTDYIAVLDKPVADFTVEMSNGNQAAFENNSQWGVAYLWDFGDGASSTEKDPTHTYNEEGQFTVVLIVTNSCGSDTTSLVVSAVLPPTADFSASPTQGCAPLTVQFQNASSPSVTAWNWTFPGGNPATSTEANPIVTYDQAGVYDVQLEVSNAVGQGAVEKIGYIQVRTTPVASFTSVNNNGTVSFTNTSLYGQAFEWTFGDGGSSTEENPQHTYAEEGGFLVTLTVLNDCGVHTISQLVEVIFAPRAGVGADQTQGCGETLTVQFFNQSTGENDSWSWMFEGGLPDASDEENPVVTYNLPGVYDVTLIARGPGGADTLYLPGYIVFASETPQAKFTSEVDALKVSFTNLSERGISWFWDFGDGNSSTEENPVHIYTGNDIYTVMLIAYNPCGADTMFANVQVVGSSTALPDYLRDLRLLPNPSSGNFVLELEGNPVGELRYDVIDVLGQVIHRDTFQFTTTRHSQEIRLGDVPQGSYFLRLWQGDRLHTRLLQVVR